MLNSLHKHLKSMTRALDILYVLENLKPVSRIIIKEDNLNKLLKKHKLKSTISDFRIKKIVNNNLYSDKGIKNLKEGSSFLYISKNKKLAEQAKEAEEDNNHKKLGKLLGYPNCCIKFFEDNFPIESKKSNDYTLATLRNSTSFILPFQNNITLRHMDLALISHFPCSFHCKHSIKIAEKNLKTIEKHSKEIAAIMGGMLQGAVIYTKDQGIFALRDIELNTHTLKYGRIMASTNNQIYSLLKKSQLIKIKNKNQFKIEKTEFIGHGIMVFT